MRKALLDELLSVATAAATAAAVVIQSEFPDRGRDVLTKSSPTDMVTKVDRAAERCIVTVLSECRPQDAILAEEGTETGGTSGITWVVDPLDGTTNYLFGVPAYSVSVAAEMEGTALIGVVVDPNRDETWQAVRGRGASVDGRPLSLDGPCPELSSALIGTGFSYLPERRAYQAGLLPHLLPRVRDIRRFGSAALDLCWVAGGRLNGYYELGLQPWDLAAGVLIAREAGAEVATQTDGTVVVAAPGLLGPLQALLAEAAKTNPMPRA
ncbi:MAG: inositol monophosphatase [Actinomycetota bacterium]|nr:inositol monophosphatase [Actinomycetota bacterium]